MVSEIFLVILFLLLIYHLNKRPENLPPGIWGWPLIGKLPGIHISMIDQVTEYSKKYGDIFMWRIGGRINVFLCKYDIIKSTMSRSELAYRPPVFSFDVYTDGAKIGLGNSGGEVSVANRRFTIRHLRDLGMGKTQFETVIQDEVSCFMKDLEQYADGQPREVPWSLSVAILNVIWRITADRRYEVDDPEIHQFAKLNDRLFNDVGALVLMYDMIPWLPKVVPGFISRWGGIDSLLKDFKTLKSFMMEIVESHQKSLDPENPRDYIDFYLIEMDKEKDDPNSHRNYKDLIISVADLFTAGSETLSSTMRWSILYFAKYLDVQKKVQAEIDSVVGSKDLPSLEHRGKLPYFDACTMEIQRHISLAGLALPHYASEDITIGGYNIPKGSAVMASVECCHHDPSYFEKPDDFYPENFLDSNGQVIAKKEGYLPFNVGKRACPGESLAYMEIYLFMAAILKNFNFTLPEGEAFNTKRNPSDRLVNACKPYKVIIQKRT